MRIFVLTSLFTILFIGAYAQNFESFKAFHGSDFDAFEDIDMDVDANGNKYIIAANATNVHYDTSSTDFDPGAVVNKISGHAMILAKYDAATNLVWVKKFPKQAHSHNYFDRIKVNASGDIFILGHAAGNGNGWPDSLDLDPSAGAIYVNDNSGNFIAKFNTNGDLQQVKTIMKPVTVEYYTKVDIYDFHLDTSENITVAGRFYGNYNVDPASSSSTLVETDSVTPVESDLETYFKGFILQYDASLNFVNVLKVNSSNYIKSIAKDTDGNILALARGYNESEARFYLNIIKYSQSNFPSELWRKDIKLNMEYPFVDFPYFIRTDANNNVIITGSKVGSASTLDFDPANPGTNTLNSQRPALFIVKYDTWGAIQWSKMIRDSFAVNTINQTVNIGNWVFEVAANGDIVLNGFFNNTNGYYIDFDPGAGSHVINSGDPNPGTSLPYGLGNAYVLRLNAQGNYVAMQTIYLRLRFISGGYAFAGTVCQGKLINGSLFLFGHTYGFANFRIFPSLGGRLDNPTYAQNGRTYVSGFITKYTLCPTITSNITGNICIGSSYNFGNQTLTAPGNYSRTTMASNGCSDSVINLVLNPAVDTSVVLNSGSLTAQQSGAIYQWINCANNTLIQGANSQSFTPAVAGNYKVALSLNNCLDTSGCHSVIPTGIANVSFQKNIILYPNPVKEVLSIGILNGQKVGRITITDVLGREVSFKVIKNSNRLISLDIKALPGIYCISLFDGGSVCNLKFLKD